MAYPVTLNGRTYTLADFEGTNYVDGLPDAFEDFVTHAGSIYKTTSTTSNTIGTGSKSFTTADNSLPYQEGTPLRISDGAAPATNWMDGIVTAYSGTSLTVNVVSYAGSGTLTDWDINIGGGGTSYTGTLPIAQGGTGATTAGAAATNLGLGTGDSPTFAGLTVDTNTLYVDSTNNRVGIGTASPASVLHLSTSNDPIITLTDTGFGASADITGSNGNLRLNSQTATIFDMADSEVARIDSSGNVGIGTATPSSVLDVEVDQDAETNIELTNTNTGSSAQVRTKYTTDGGLFTVGKTSDAHPYGGDAYIYNVDNTNIRFATSDTERMRIDSSGNLLVGKTSANSDNAGFEANSTGFTAATRSNGTVFVMDRLTSDGEIVSFRKDNTSVGSIGSVGSRLYIGTSDTTIRFKYGAGDAVVPANGSGALRDNAMDVGASAARWDDIYATNGTIQTSDANEKQQIASFTDAEITAAKAISKLFRTFKWNDKVAEKGDAARTHTGVIAQDVAQAMTDAGLDAGNYAFFISSTWWETQTEVPAVEAVDEVVDEDGNVITEAVEAQEAYTRTDTYDTAEEAPEGATERTRLGIRYPELLAFIGAATEQRLASIEARLDALETP